MITLSRDPGPMHYPLIVNDDGRDILVQTDTDYPGVARTFGWSVASVTHDIHGRLVRSTRGAPCDHIGTDGTIPCDACGASAITFIDSAAEFLRDNVGATADDPGYFLEDMTARTCNGHRPGEPCR
jgi:hypothetical protein